MLPYRISYFGTSCTAYLWSGHGKVSRITFACLCTSAAAAAAAAAARLQINNTRDSL
jgi:hypothetical protein